MKRFSLTVVSLSVLVMFFAMTTSALEIDESIVLMLNFDDDNDLLKDSSIYGHTGTINGAVKAGGKVGNGLEFNGVDSYVQIPRTDQLDISAGITLAAYVFKSEIVEKNEVLVSKKQGGAYCLELNGWNNAVPHKPDSEMRISGTYHRLNAPDDIPTGRWVHVASTYDGTFMKIYVDGVMVAEGEWPGTIDINTADVFLGCDSGGTSPEGGADTFLAGIIDEVLIANRALDDSEMAMLAEGMTAAAVDPSGSKLSTTWGTLKGSH